MSEATFYSVGQYNTPFTQHDRDRTVAAIYLAQGASKLGYGPMRRDVLTFLMSPTAVGYWLNTKGWFEKCGSVGKVQLLRLTPAGISQCGSISGPSANVRAWMQRMLHPANRSATVKSFEPLSFICDGDESATKL